MRRARIAILPIVLPLIVALSFGGDETEPRKLVNQANEAYETGNHESCGRLYARAIELGAGSATVPYNAACCYALSGNMEQAFRMLDLSLERGWRDPEHLGADTDLQGLHADERWQKVIERATAARETHAKSVNQELLRMYEEDQGDRSGEIDWSKVAQRDEQRRRRVREMLEAGEVEAADDYFHAAMVLQHGQGPEDYELAHELALKASEMDPNHSTARWLAAAAKDRYLHGIGEPQIYGTQFRRVDGEWTLEPIDESAVSDEERARWGVPPLASAKERAAAMNGRDRNTIPPCDGPGATDFVRDLRDRLLRFDGLAGFARERFGSPQSCRGKVTSRFDGMEFGTVTLGFAGGATLEVETMPPEGSLVMLRIPDGFENADAGRKLLQGYVENVGAEIDWTSPTTTKSQTGEITETFESTESGTNASAALVFDGDRLVALRFGIAL